MPFSKRLGQKRDLEVQRFSNYNATSRIRYRDITNADFSGKVEHRFLGPWIITPIEIIHYNITALRQPRVKPMQIQPWDKTGQGVR